jgi:hypothetical protein
VEGAGEEEAESSGLRKETNHVLHSLNHGMSFFVMMRCTAPAISVWIMFQGRPASFFPDLQSPRGLGHTTSTFQVCRLENNTHGLPW